MRAVIQRVSEASVTIDEQVKASIGQGLIVFLGIESKDTRADVIWLSSKIPRIRIFPDEAGLMNRSLLDCGGEILLISQFTLYGNLRKGMRPSFNRAALPENAIPLYQEFIEALSAELGRPVATGEFGGYMKIFGVNDGPVTLILDTKDKRL